MVLRYEDLVSDPSRWLDELCEFVGVAPHVDWDRHADLPHHIVGNRSRMRSGSSAKIRLDDAWKREMRPADREAVTRITGAWARRYGYASGDGDWSG